MTGRHDPGMDADIELLAYADGFLDNEPERRADVERRVNASPELAARVEAYRAQSAALRRAYGYRAQEPVPEHLMAMLDAPPLRPRRAALAAAAVITLTVGAGLFGWMLGSGALSGGGEDFLARSYDNYVADAYESGPGARRLVKADKAEPLNWLSQKLSLTLRAPDLTAQGYSIVDTRTVEGGSRDDMLRLTYSSDDGRSFSLFLYPRWQESQREIRMAREGDVSLAYWLEGPLASVIASRLPPGEIRAVSEAVRRSLNDPEATRPELGPAKQPAGKIAGGIALPESGVISPGEPALPAPMPAKSPEVIAN